jgi:hypothetical protein
MVNSTLGPGTAMMTVAMAANVRVWLAVMTPT